MADRHDPEQQLTGLREQIDAVDEQLLTLLNQRAQCARDVARVKQQALETRWQNGERDIRQPEEVVFYRPEREAQILRTVMDRNPGATACG